MTDSHETRAVFAAAVAGVLVGSGIVATRFVIAQSDPITLAFLRYFIGVLCLLPPLLLSARVRIARADLLPIALLGVAQFGILVGLLNFALLYITAALGALIFATVPLLTLLMAALFRVESLTAIKALGVVFAVLGVAVALADRVEVATAPAPLPLGVLAAFGAALTGALCNVFYRPYLRRYPTVPVSAYAMFCAVVVLALSSLAMGDLGKLDQIDLPGWTAVVFIGISSGGGYYLWLWALKHTTPTRVAVFLNLSPLVAALLGFLLLAEPVSWRFAVGLAFVATGLWLTSRAVDKPGPAPIEPAP